MDPAEMIGRHVYPTGRPMFLGRIIRVLQASTGTDWHSRNGVVLVTWKDGTVAPLKLVGAGHLDARIVSVEQKLAGYEYQIAEIRRYQDERAAKIGRFRRRIGQLEENIALRGIGWTQ